MSLAPSLLSRRATLLDNTQLNVIEDFRAEHSSHSQEHLSPEHKIVYSHEKRIKKNKHFWSNVDSLDKDTLKPENVDTAIHKTLSWEKQAEKEEEVAETEEECLDSVKSGESVFKLFTFKPSKHGSNTEKCVAFWKMIMSRDDIKPVDCSLKMESSDKSLNESKTSLNESQSKASCDKLTMSWADVLLQLQRRNLDKVAAAATFNRCKFCNYYPASLSDIKEDTDDCKSDIINLNSWRPKKKTESPEFQSDDNKDLSAISAAEALMKQCDTCRCKVDALIAEKTEEINKDVSLKHFTSTSAKRDESTTRVKDNFPKVEKYTQKIDQNKHSSTVDFVNAPVKISSEKQRKGSILKTVPSKGSINVESSPSKQKVSFTSAKNLSNEKSTEKVDMQKSAAGVSYFYDCGESDCLCNIETKETTKEKETPSTKVEEFLEMNEIQSSSISNINVSDSCFVTEGTQYPERKQPINQLGKHCIICGLKICRCEAVEPTTKDAENATQFNKIAEEIINFALSKDTKLNLTQANTSVIDIINQLHKKYKHPREQKKYYNKEFRECWERMKNQPVTKEERREKRPIDDIEALERAKLEEIAQKFHEKHKNLKMEFSTRNETPRKSVASYNNAKVYYPKKKLDKVEKDTGPGRKL